MPEEAPPNRGSALKGAAIGFGVTIAVPLAMSLSGGMLLLIGIGVIQLAWMLPLYLYFRKRGATETAKGILLAGSIVLLLNAACFGVVVFGGLRIGG